MELRFADDYGNVYIANEEHVASGGATIAYTEIMGVAFKAPSFLTGGRIEIKRAAGPVYVTWKSKQKTAEAENFYKFIQAKIG